ncbi:2-oxoacid ferredoxin oxidoreductase [compost metagenome]
MLAGLRSDNLQLARELLELPNSVRGYGPVKERFLHHAHQRQAQLLEQWRNGSTAQFHDASQAIDKISIIQL